MCIIRDTNDREFENKKTRRTITMTNRKSEKKEEQHLIRGIIYETEEALIPGVSYVPEELVRGVIYDEEVDPNSEKLADQNENLIRGVYCEEEAQVMPQDKTTLMEVPNERKEIVQNVIKNLCDNQLAMQVKVASTLNFDLVLLRRLVEVYDIEGGELEENKYLIKVIIRHIDGEVSSYQAEVSADQAKEIRWLKKATNSLATLPKGKEQIAEFETKIQRCLETRDVPTERVYRNAGWRDVPNLGWRYVFDGGIVGSQNDLVHTVRNQKYTLELRPEKLGALSTFEMTMEMCHLCKSRIASTELLIFVHATVLSELFEQAGYPLNFAFGIMGVTNSRKTSLVTTMAQLFHREKLKADAEFATATSCGIEKTLGLYRDAPVLIDDFKPGVNRAKQAQLDAKLDELLRFAGNRVSKQRMLDFMPSGNKKYFPINGGIIMTMELVTGVLSSLTRMFLTEISVDEVQNDKLRYYQEERWILPTHMYDFLSWITENFQWIVVSIKERFPYFRLQHPAKIGRHSEMYATMQITAEILGCYAKSRGFWKESEIQTFLGDVDIIVRGELLRMDARARKRDKGQFVIEAFLDALKRGTISPIQLNKTTSQEKNDLYENERLYFARANSLRCLTNQYALMHQEQIEIINDDELIGALERIKVLEVYERKDGSISRSRKLPIQSGNALCYLYLKKSALKEMEIQ